MGEEDIILGFSPIPELLMKTLLLLLFLAGGIFFLRVNLPQDDIAASVAESSDVSILQSALISTLGNRLAQWNRLDLIVLKLACSENLQMMFIALPFKSWERMEREVEECPF